MLSQSRGISSPHFIYIYIYIELKNFKTKLYYYKFTHPFDK